MAISDKEREAIQKIPIGAAVQFYLHGSWTEGSRPIGCNVLNNQGGVLDLSEQQNPARKHFGVHYIGDDEISEQARKKSGGYGLLGHYEHNEADRLKKERAAAVKRIKSSAPMSVKRPAHISGNGATQPTPEEQSILHRWNQLDKSESVEERAKLCASSLTVIPDINEAMVLGIVRKYPVFVNDNNPVLA